MALEKGKKKVHFDSILKTLLTCVLDLGQGRLGGWGLKLLKSTLDSFKTYSLI
jgi:hypothetical protein